MQQAAREKKNYEVLMPLQHLLPYHLAHHRQPLSASIFPIISLPTLSSDLIEFAPPLAPFSRRDQDACFETFASCKSNSFPFPSCPYMADFKQLPRTSSVSRLSQFRQPTSTLLSRYASSHAGGGEEKVKGQVIGIDLGEWHPSECLHLFYETTKKC